MRDLHHFINGDIDVNHFFYQEQGLDIAQGFLHHLRRALLRPKKNLNFLNMLNRILTTNFMRNRNTSVGHVRGFALFVIVVVLLATLRMNVIVSVVVVVDVVLGGEEWDLVAILVLPL